MKSMRKVQKASGLILGGSGMAGRAVRLLIIEVLAILHQSPTTASLVREALRAHRFVGLHRTPLETAVLKSDMATLRQLGQLPGCRNSGVDDDKIYRFPIPILQSAQKPVSMSDLPCYRKLWDKASASGAPDIRNSQNQLQIRRLETVHQPIAASFRAPARRNIEQMFR